MMRKLWRAAWSTKRQSFYRYARYVHGWLSAFAFLSLMFFALTGWFLNHPDWFATKNDEQQIELPLTPTLQALLLQPDPPIAEILQHLRRQTILIGRYQSSEAADDDLMIRLASPAGQTDIWVSASAQTIEVTRSPATVVGVLNDLHRGKQVASIWRWWIDLSVVVILVLSLAGYCLFFAMQQRLLTALALTALGISAFAALLFISI